MIQALETQGQNLAKIAAAGIERAKIEQKLWEAKEGKRNRRQMVKPTTDYTSKLN